jgi:hypothetical protein
MSNNCIILRFIKNVPMKDMLKKANILGLFKENLLTMRPPICPDYKIFYSPLCYAAEKFLSLGKTGSVC